MRIAIIGTGSIADSHANAYEDLDEWKVVAACDIRPGKAESFAEEHDVPAVYADFRELLDSEELDAVSVCTWDEAHRPISVAAFQAGLHVMCEKPLANSYEDARAMAEAAADSGLVNIVNFSYRNAPAIQRARDYVQGGKIGTVRHVEASYFQSWLCGAWFTEEMDRKPPWRLSSERSLGVLGDLGVHIIDFATYPVGGITRVFCNLATYPKADTERVKGEKLDANDSAVINAEFANGALGTIHTTRRASGHSNSLRLRIYGEEASVVVDLDESWDSFRVATDGGWSKGEWETIECEPTPTNFQRFARSVETGQNDQPDFARAAAIQKVLDACVESDRTERPVEV
jgi:predicted dehydrogenase